MPTERLGDSDSQFASGRVATPQEVYEVLSKYVAISSGRHPELGIEPKITPEDDTKKPDNAAVK